MTGSRLILGAAVAVALQTTRPATAGSSVVQRTLDAGGGRFVSTRFVLDASLGSPGGPASAVGLGLRAGYAGQLNEPPVLVDDTFPNRRLSRTLRISLAALLANDVDAEGDPITVTAVTATSVVGAVLEVSEGWVVYRPAPLPLAVDEFTYWADDGVGGTAVGTVTLEAGTVDPGVTPNRVGLPAPLPGGGVRVTFAGIPGRTYAIEVTDDLTPPAVWQVLACGPTAANGLITADDTAPSGSARFYRTVELSECPP